VANNSRAGRKRAQPSQKPPGDSKPDSMAFIRWLPMPMSEQSGCWNGVAIEFG
jgi:hypothetical protein